MIHLGDCLDVLKTLPDASVDSVVTDPPYELGFMGKKWDASGIAYRIDLWREVLRVLRPGGHLLAFGGTRTYHRMAVAIEDAGFEIRDSLHWLYGSGFPKSLDVSKAIDKAAGAERSDGARLWSEGARSGGIVRTSDAEVTATRTIFDTPATDAARKWSGFGTALKPAHEPVVVARKPLAGTVAANVQQHGTGALNIDGCRVRMAEGERPSGSGNSLGYHGNGRGTGGNETPSSGRWPPNLLLSHTPDCNEACAEYCAVAEMDRQQDGASRFFPVFRYQAKASRSERNAGLDGFPEALPLAPNGSPNAVGASRGSLSKPRANVHPTVKPVELMRWLVRLVTPPGGVVLDPFTGSGTTGMACVLEGFRFIGIEREPEYHAIATARVEHAKGQQPAQAELFGGAS